MHERRETEPPPDVARGHETRDISTRVVVIFGISLAVGAVLVQAAIWLLYLHFAGVAARADPHEYPMARSGAPALPPAPRLQTRPREDLKQMRAEENEYLETYGWVDANGGVVHIPIERAMRLTIEQGLPARGDRGAAPPAGREK